MALRAGGWKEEHPWAGIGNLLLSYGCAQAGFCKKWSTMAKSEARDWVLDWMEHCALMGRSMHFWNCFGDALFYSILQSLRGMAFMLIVSVAWELVTNKKNYLFLFKTTHFFHPYAVEATLIYLLKPPTPLPAEIVKKFNLNATHSLVILSAIIAWLFYISSI